jgi:hypothetical protein
MSDEKLRRILEDKKLRVMLEEASPQQEIERLRDEIARLRLTDEEREAVEYFAAFHRSPREADANAAATLRKMLERLGGGV